jgi:hypothetical protein
MVAVLSLHLCTGSFLTVIMTHFWGCSHGGSEEKEVAQGHLAADISSQCRAEGSGPALGRMLAVWERT